MLAEMAATASKDSLQGLLNNSREVGNQLSAQVKNLLRDTTKMGTVSAISEYVECQHDRTGKTECAD